MVLLACSVVFPNLASVAYSFCVALHFYNILTWLCGFQDKLLYLVLFSLYPSLFWELRDKKKLKIYNFDP